MRVVRAGVLRESSGNRAVRTVRTPAGVLRENGGKHAAQAVRRRATAARVRKDGNRRLPSCRLAAGVAIPSRAARPVPAARRDRRPRPPRASPRAAAGRLSRRGTGGTAPDTEASRSASPARSAVPRSGPGSPARASRATDGAPADRTMRHGHATVEPEGEPAAPASEAATWAVSLGKSPQGRKASALFPPRTGHRPRLRPGPSQPAPGSPPTHHGERTGLPASPSGQPAPAAAPCGCRCRPGCPLSQHPHSRRRPAPYRQPR